MTIKRTLLLWWLTQKSWPVSRGLQFRNIGFASVGFGLSLKELIRYRLFCVAILLADLAMSLLIFPV